MEKQNLGKSDIAVYPWALGGNVFGWTANEKESYEVLDAFVQQGFNFIDTADSYSSWVPGNKGGESETIIGKWMKERGNRRGLIVATKVGSDLGGGKKGLRKDYILRAAEDSLKRLQTDYIDLYQTHFDDESVPVEETLEAYTQLLKEGKIRAIGASNMSPERLLASLKASEQNGYAPYISLQPEYNLYQRQGYETKYEPICKEYGLGVINYYALASGFLTGKYRTEEDLNKSQRGGGVRKFMNERGFGILQALDDVAERHNTTPAAVSIAWLLSSPTITAPIASATSLKQVEELAWAVALKLDDEDVQQLDDASKY